MKWNKGLKSGIAIEHTCRAALQTRLKAIQAYNDHKRLVFGTPDLLVKEGERSIGFLETKELKETILAKTMCTNGHALREIIQNMIGTLRGWL